jgi:hypothetical protein
MLDPIQRQLALDNVDRCRALHRDADGQCEHCWAPWPCEASYRVELARAVLAPAAIWRARVHPAWVEGRPLGGQRDSFSGEVEANRP